jgi:hypothetical protein
LRSDRLFLVLALACFFLASSSLGAYALVHGGAGTNESTSVTTPVITFVGSGPLADYNGPVSTLTVSLPAGVQAGDTLLAQIVIYDGSGSDVPTVPSGWTAIRHDSVSNGNRITTWLYFKVAATTEPASYEWNVSPNWAAGVIAAWRGASGSPIDAASGAMAAFASPVADSTPSLVPSNNNEMQICFYGAQSQTSPVLALSASVTELFDVSSSKEGFALAFADFAAPSAGISSPSYTATASTSGSAAMTAQAVLLIPASIGGTAKPTATTTPTTTRTGTPTATSTAVVRPTATATVTAKPTVTATKTATATITAKPTATATPSSSITFVGAGLLADYSSMVMTVIVGIPAGVQTGDTLLAQIIVFDSSASDVPTAPNGWTAIRHDAVGNGAKATSWVYSKVAGASEPTSYSWNISSNWAAGVMGAWRGASTSPIDKASGSTSVGASLFSLSAPSLVPVNNKELQIYFYGAQSSTAPTVALSNALNQRLDEKSSKEGFTLAFADLAAPSAGNASATYPATVTNAAMTAQAILLVPQSQGSLTNPTALPPEATPTPATAVITAPTNGATISGIVNISSQPQSGADYTYIYIDGAYFAQRSSSPTSWNSTTVANGAHTIGAQSFLPGNTAGTGVNSITVTVVNSSVSTKTPTPIPSETGSLTFSATPTVKATVVQSPTTTPTQTTTPIPTPGAPGAVWTLQSTSTGFQWVPPNDGTPLCKYAAVSLVGRTYLSPSVFVSKYGNSGANLAAAAATRLQSWGFNAAGYYSDDYAVYPPAGGPPYTMYSQSSSVAADYVSSNLSSFPASMVCGSSFYSTNQADYFALNDAAAYQASVSAWYSVNSSVASHAIALFTDEADNPFAINKYWHNDYGYIIAAQNPTQIRHLGATWAPSTKRGSGGSSALIVDANGNYELTTTAGGYQGACKSGTSTPAWPPLGSIGATTSDNAGGGTCNAWVSIGSARDHTVYAKLKLADVLANEYGCSGSPFTNDPFGASYCGSSNAATALAALNTAWSTSYTTFGTSDPGGLAGIKAGTYASYGTGTGLLDEKGTNLLPASPSCGSILMTASWAKNATIESDLHAYMGQFAAQYVTNELTAWRQYFPNVLFITLYDPPTYIASAIASAMKSNAGNNASNVLWTATGEANTPLVETQGLIAAMPGVPIIAADYWQAQADSPYASTTCADLGSQPGTCFATQALRGAALASYWQSVFGSTDVNNKHTVVGLEHWEYYDQGNANTNYGLVTDLDNPYDGSADIANGEAANYGDAITPISDFLNSNLCDP